MRMTKKDAEKIREEIAYRQGPLREELLAALKAARALGDLSENADYTASKRANNQNNSRIRYLENLLRGAEIIEDRSKEGEVGLNKTVRVYIPEDDEEETYKIVTTIRGDSVNGRISTESPLGKALLGKKAGDRVTVRVNERYSYEVVIRAVSGADEGNEDALRQY